MNNYRKVGNGLTPSALQLRKRIRRNRTRAISYGLLYLLGIIAFAIVVAVDFPPMLVHKDTPILITKIYEPLLDLDLNTVAGLTRLITCILYTIILITVLVSVFKGFAKLGWLFKKTANETHGFNRNVYAMLDLGNLFSRSLTVIVINYFLVALLTQTTEFNLSFYVMLAVGVVLHFLCGLGGAKANFYDVENGQVIEQKRVVGRFAPFCRNLLQIIAVIASMFLLLTFNTETDSNGNVNTIILPILEAVEAGTIMNDIGSLLWNILLVVAIFGCLTVLVAHAMGITEYNIDGAEGKGMRIRLGDELSIVKCCLFDLLFLALVAVALIMSGKMDAINLWIVVGISLFMFIFEIVARKLPKYPEDRIPMEKIDRNEEREVALNDFSKTYADSVVENTMDKSQATREDLERNYASNMAAMAAAQQKAYPNTQPGQSVAPYAQPGPQNGQQQIPAYPYPPYPYPVYPQPQQQQSLLPIVAGMSLLPMFANMSMMNGMNQAANAQAQGNVTLPSQMVRDAVLRNGSASDLEKILFADSDSNGRQGRKAAKARAKALRMMARMEDEDDAAMASDDESVVEDSPIKISVECPCCHKKLHVTSVAMYNRCPSCKTVFQVRGANETK